MFDYYLLRTRERISLSAEDISRKIKIKITELLFSNGTASAWWHDQTASS